MGVLRAAALTVLHLVVPAGLDDPARPSGGNTYDRRLSQELRTCGRTVREHEVTDASDAGDVLAGLPDGALVLVDGLVASPVLVASARRLRMAILLHMFVGDECERAVLSAAAAVITTSRWGRDQVVARHRVRGDRVHVAVPGTDPAPLARGTAGGGALLCVAAVAEHKGHDVLVRALASIGHLDWHCLCAGSLTREPAFVERLRREAAAAGVADRITFAGALGAGELGAAYASADLLLHPSRGEMYGMVVAEALARGLPVVASDVGGVPEALAGTGILVPAGEPEPLAAAIRQWLSSPARRAGLRSDARARRTGLPDWRGTAAAVAAALDGIG